MGTFFSDAYSTQTTLMELSIIYDQKDLSEAFIIYTSESQIS